MNRFVYLLLSLLMIHLFFYKCANPGSPTGGPTDTIPPILIKSSPVLGFTNFSDSELTLEFSKDISADKLKKELIITPKSDLDYTFLVKKNKLIIKLKGPLQDSTTYNLNFADGITSITEKIPTINLSLAFSTGSFIDSMSVQGYTKELLTKEPATSYIIGLYPHSDTLNYSLQKPLYFTSANDSGYFKLEYIKKGTYKILAFKDENKNLILDSDTESHGFLKDTLLIDSSLTLNTLRCVLQDIRPIKLINAISVAPYFELRYNKTIGDYKIEPDNFYHNIIGKNNNVIRVYKPDNISYKDSLTTMLSVNDSLLNITKDTVKFIFLESERKPTPFSYSFDTPNVILDDTTNLSLSFNKPVLHTDTSKIYFYADSTFKYTFQKQVRWNATKTKATLTFAVNKDSLLSAYTSHIPFDTIQTDTSESFIDEPTLSSVFLAIETKAFVSIENDTSIHQSIHLYDFKEKSTGTLNINLTTDYTHFIVQLLGNRNRIKYQSRNQINTKFIAIKTGSYRIRILIDENNDLIWSYGNLLKNEEPEKVFLYDETISIIENWIVDLDISF